MANGQSACYYDCEEYDVGFAVDWMGRDLGNCLPKPATIDGISHLPLWLISSAPKSRKLVEANFSRMKPDGKIDAVKGCELSPTLIDEKLCGSIQSSFLKTVPWILDRG